MSTPAPLTVGTAGHIDHGKTVLVRALTGRDTDRLPEEKERGISIALGYAELDLGDRTVSLIDVPGHERFVRTMIAGATGIDMFLLVVAADDGPMPQTHEHLAVLRGLGIDEGVVALTKCDLVDAAAQANAAAATRALLPDAPLVEVSARQGDGIEELRRAVAETAGRTRRRTEAEAGAAPVLHVDRVFTLPGQGTIVTGTLWRGRIAKGDGVRLLPSALGARVRSIQIHDRDVEIAEPRQRVALNLTGVRRDDVRRGDVVTSAESGLQPFFRLDVELAGDRAVRLESGVRVQVHHGTREAPARVVQLGEGLAQLRLERPLIAAAGERIILRRLAPPDTLGGAIVLDPAPPRHGPGADPASTRDGGRQEPLSAAEARQEAEPRPPELDREALRVFALLRADGFSPRGPDELAQELSLERDVVVDRLERLREAGGVVRLKPQLYIPAATLDALREQAVEIARSEGAVTIAALRDRAGTSRRYAQALLEHLDSEKVLLRQADRHVLRSGAH